MKSIQKLMGLIMPDCEETAHRTWLLQSRFILTHRQQFGLKMHLSLCKNCRNNSKELKTITDVLTKVPGAPHFDVAYSMKPELKREIKAALQEVVPRSDDGNDPD